MNDKPTIGFCEAIKLGFKNYVYFEGRSRRSEYWFFILLVNLITIITFTLLMVFVFTPKKIKVEEKRYYPNSYKSNDYYSNSYNSNYYYSTYYHYTFYENEIIAMLIIFCVYHSAIIIPFFSATTRRLHDIGKS